LQNNHSLVAISAFFVLFSIKNAAGYLIAKAHYQFNSDVAVRISERSLEAFQHGSFEDFVHIDSSRFVRKIAIQPFEFCQHVLYGIQQILTQLFLVTLTVAAIVVYNPNLFFLLLCVLLPPVSFVFYVIKKKLAQSKKDILTSNELSYRYLFEALKGYVEGNIYGRNQFFLRRFMTVRRAFSTHLFTNLRLQNLPGRMMEVFAVMGLFVLIVLAKWTAHDNSANLLTIGTFMAAAYKIIPGIVKIINLTGLIRTYEYSVMDLEENNFATKNHTDQSSEIHSIQLKNIRFQYNGVPTLQNVSLCMQKGDFVGITGKSGKGKTTLLHVLLGLLPNHDGHILINEQAMTTNELKTFWPSMAYVRQQGFLIHDTLLRNITLTQNDVNHQRLSEAIHLAGLEEFVNKTSGGLEKVIAENGKDISGGQQQRIALARALYKDADLILLDEPFNELDEASELSIIKSLQNIAAAGKIVVMVTHNKKAISYCTKTVSLDEN
jgi:ABC-type bacteriocin/lantibiotic exporter with double-glycine peptidase domain